MVLKEENIGDVKMEHWIYDLDSREKVATEGFFEELESVCRKYNISIAHEDYHGGFILDTFCEDNLEWLKSAALTKKAYDEFQLPFE